MLDGANLDFTQPATLDQYGGTGWGRAEDAGSTSRGGESRLVLPLAADLGHAATSSVSSRCIRARWGRPSRYHANQVRVALVDVSPASSTHRVTISSALLEGTSPLEIAFRRVRPSALARRGMTDIRLERVQVRASRSA